MCKRYGRRSPFVTNWPRALSFLALGYMAGAVCTIAVLVYMLRDPELFGKIVLTVGPDFSRALDPTRRLAKADAALAAASDEYQRWLALSDAAMMNAEAGSA